MGKIANRMLAFADKVEQSLNSRLQQFAEDTEELTKASAHWQDDSGSAKAATTGYLVGVDDAQKNFAASEWMAAQRAGFISPRHKNPASNYQPHTEEHPVAAEDKAVILTTFVEYGEKLETMPQTAGTFQGVMESTRDDFKQAVRDAIAEAVARA